jgi:acetamidase/formamidase
MTTYVLEPLRETLIGCFSPEHAPILTIDPGDTVRYRTLDAGWGLEPNDSEHPRRKFEPRNPGTDSGHCLVGPVAIRGAQPGMTLAIEIGAIIPGHYGNTFVGGWDHPVNQRFKIAEGTGERLHVWTLDTNTMIGRNQHGHSVALRPFMGVMGVAPPEAGLHPTPPPRRWGGNLDCKALTSGSTLYLPIGVEGALFYVGDGHAAQGDGEVCVTAIECPMERVELTFPLHDDMPLNAPRARTPEGWVTFGVHEDLEEAMYLALEEMVALMQTLYGIDQHDALGLASVTVDLRITQIVNGVRGVHAVLPYGAVR